MKKYLKISIITPSFNQSNFIKQTIDSILQQNYPNLEYIVMDGGSTDNTVEILKSYDHQIIWKSEKDRGQSEAINKGLKMATGEILAYINSDDLYIDNCLFKVNDFFLKNLNIKWAYGRCRIIDENNREIRKLITAYKNFWMNKYSYSKLLSLNFINQPSTFWRREIKEELGLFNEDEHLVMDYEYWLRIGRKYPAGFIRDYLADFRMYSHSKGFQFFKKQFHDELRVAKKYSSNQGPIFFHYLNYLSIIMGYKILQKF
jgi:glycosyltransferase involved in cell wall biosynthesis